MEMRIKYLVGKRETPARAVVIVGDDEYRIGALHRRIPTALGVLWQRQIQTGEFHNIFDEGGALEAAFCALDRASAPLRSC